MTKVMTDLHIYFVFQIVTPPHLKWLTNNQNRERLCMLIKITTIERYDIWDLCDLSKG